MEPKYIRRISEAGLQKLGFLYNELAYNGQLEEANVLYQILTKDIISRQILTTIGIMPDKHNGICLIGPKVNQDD